MALAQIRQYPDAALKMEARPVEEFDDELQSLVERMKLLMVDANGIGLAATQVGVLRRVFVFQPDEDESRSRSSNPEIVERSEETDVADEGCLSIQGITVPVERSLEVTIVGQGRERRRRPVRARRLRRALRPARDRPPRRRADDRPHDARSAARGARQAAPAHRPHLVARIAVAATAPFGADVLERLAQQHDVALLLTRPDKPRGRGRKLAPTPAKEVAERLGIPVAQPARLDESVEIPADTVVVAAYGLLIPESLLERALWLNVHPSLLPRWRGAAPVERALMAGDTRTGVTIHRTTAELDAGPIAAQEAFDVGPDDDAGAVFARSAEIAARLLDDVLAEPRFAPQPEEGVTYAEKIAPEDRELDLVRPGAGARRTTSARSRRTSARAPSSTAGRSWSGRRASATTARSSSLEVQPEGGRRMPYDAYLRGLR